MTCDYLIQDLLFINNTLQAKRIGSKVQKRLGAQNTKNAIL